MNARLSQRLHSFAGGDAPRMANSQLLGAIGSSGAAAIGEIADILQ